MTRKDYTNEQLAAEYLLVETAGLTLFDARKYKQQRTRISQSDINITNFYYNHGYSLAELSVPGIGESTKDTLVLILKQGIKKAKELKIKQREGDLERRFHTIKPQSSRKLGEDDANNNRFRSKN